MKTAGERMPAATVARQPGVDEAFCGARRRGLRFRAARPPFPSRPGPPRWNLSRNQPGVREYAAHRDAARRGVHLVVDEVDRRLVREAVLVLQPQQDREVSVRRRRDLAFRDRLADLQQGRFIHVEIDIHRVQRHDRGQERLVLVDQVSEGEVIAAHLAVDRRHDLRELLVQFVDLQALLLSVHRASASTTAALYWSSACSLTAPGVVLARAW